MSSKHSAPNQATDPAASSAIDFGFDDIARHEKTARVRDVFARIAGRYDLMNDAMSLGLHRLWKRDFVGLVNPQVGEKILDMACGTGDIATSLYQKMKARQRNADRQRLAAITACDINEAMLQQGRHRQLDRGHWHSLNWLTANAEALPFPDNYFDVYTIAFGLRNVTDRPQALREAWRVLKPGGRFFCLEFSRPLPALRPVYDLYSLRLIPQIGQWIADDEAAYRYLVESIRRFPNQESLRQMLQQTGFTNTRYNNMTGGIVAIHRGWKI